MRSSSLFLLGFVAAPLAACGAKTTSPALEGEPPLPGADASPPRVQPVLGPDCPSALPEENSSCTRDGLECEYGDDPDPQCNTIATCIVFRGATAPTWDEALPGSPCPTPAAPNGPACPALHASIPGGGICDAAGTVCSYPEGRCGCEIDNSAGGLPGSPPPPARWICEVLDPTCPSPRGRIGGVCTSEGKTCTYGASCLPGSVILTCHDGYWAVGSSLPCGGTMAEGSGR